MDADAPKLSVSSHSGRGLDLSFQGEQPTIDDLPSTGTAVRSKCPLCEHEWRRHDPEDGCCDAPAGLGDGFGVCPCGRDLKFMQREIALQSSAALLEGL